MLSTTHLTLEAEHLPSDLVKAWQARPWSE